MKKVVYSISRLSRFGSNKIASKIATPSREKKASSKARITRSAK